MLDVLLINFPFVSKGMPTIFPIQLAALGGHLAAHGHHVTVVDLNVDPSEKLFDLLRRKKFDVSALSFRNVLPAYPFEKFRSFREFIVKLNGLGIDPIVGGPGFSLFHPLIYDMVPEIKWGAIGEGEHTLLRFAEGDDPEKIPGFCYRTPTGVKVNYPPHFLPGPEIPPYRELDGLDYSNPAYLVGLQTYRGCNFECAYCPTSYLRGRGVRLRPLDIAEQDLKFLRDRRRGHVFFIDGVHNEPYARSLEVLDLIERLNFPRTWEGFLKPRSDIDETHVRRLAASGATRFHIDVISLSKRVGPLVGNHLVREEVFRVARLLKKHDIQGVFYYAYQLPKERLTDEARTMLDMRVTRKIGHETYIYPYFPYPGTPFEKYYGKILKKSLAWHLWRFIKMMIRPSFFMFLKNMISLDKVTGPPKEPGVGVRP